MGVCSAASRHWLAVSGAALTACIALGVFRVGGFLQRDSSGVPPELLANAELCAREKGCPVVSPPTTFTNSQHHLQCPIHLALSSDQASLFL